MNNGKLFFAAYGESFKHQPAVKIVEIGSQDLNGSLRALAPPAYEYVGVDFVAGKGVDLVLDSPCALPFSDESKAFIKFSPTPEDALKLMVIAQVINNQIST